VLGRESLCDSDHLSVCNRSGFRTRTYLMCAVKALVNGGCKSHPGTGSLHPVAIEATAQTWHWAPRSSVSPLLMFFLPPLLSKVLRLPSAGSWELFSLDAPPTSRQKS